MENRFFLSLGLGIVLCAAPFLVYAYDDQTTHPALTDQMVTLYNRLYPDDQITDAERIALRQGSIDEDILPRSVNHLYDPVHQTGWTGRAMGWVPAVVTRLTALIALLPDAPLANVAWIEADGAQEAYIRYGGNRSWPAAMRALLRGDHLVAYNLLGSSLHLLEDAGVPDHARDDTHAHQLNFITGDYGSPYETYTVRYGVGALHLSEQLSVSTQDVPHYNTPHEYLADNALYSATSFFTKDTIQDAHFALPTVTREVNGVAYGRTRDGFDVPLARRVSTWTLFSGATSSLRLGFGPEFDAVLEAQFQVLARRTLLLGVGMLRDFRTTQHGVEKAPLPTRLMWSFAGELDHLPRIATVAADGGSQLVAQAQRAYAWLHPTSQSSPSALDDLGATSSGDIIGEVLGAATSTSIPRSALQKKAASSKKSIVAKSAVTSSRPEVTGACPSSGAAHVVMNEIAWMGTSHSASDEWIELYNRDDDVHDLEGWELTSSDGKLYADLDGVRITAHGYVLLERTDDDVIPAITAAALYTGGLSNTPTSGYSLRLVDPRCGMIDLVDAQGSWPAGDAASRRTMERTRDDAWQTSALPEGTPGRVNSTGYIPLTASTTTTLEMVVTSTHTTTAVVTSTSFMVDTSTVLISEVASGGVDAGDEFVELYNPTSHAVSLLGWSLQYLPATASSTPQKRDLPDALIPGHGYFLIARATSTDGTDGYRGSVLPDVVHRTFALSVNGASLALVRSVDRIVSTSSPDVVDWVTYPKLSTNASFERAAALGDACVDPREGVGLLAGNGCLQQMWFVRTSAQPQNRSSNPEPSDTANSAVTSSWVSFPIALGMYQAQASAALWEAWALIRGTGLAPQELSTATRLIPQGVSTARFVYQACNGAVTESPVLLLPLSNLACQTGGLLSGAFAGPYWEDGHLLVNIVGSFVPGEVFQWVRYTFAGSRAGDQYFTRFSATSTLGMSLGLPPGSPTNVRVERVGALSVIYWDAAVDADSVDASLVYDVQVVGSSTTSSDQWDFMGTALSWSRELPVGSYHFLLRARDEQGNVSPSVDVSFSVDPVPPPDQLVHSDQLDPGFGSLILASPVTLRGIAVWLIPQGGPYCCSSVVVSLETPAGVVVARGQAGRRVVDGAGDTFVPFDTPVSLTPGAYVLRMQPASSLSNSLFLGGLRTVGDWNDTGSPYLRFLSQ